MKAYQKRVVAEKKSLDIKLDKLTAFLNSHVTIALLDPAEQARLILQKMLMKAYSDVLAERIEVFKLQE